jgi:hypothetical protein
LILVIGDGVGDSDEIDVEEEDWINGFFAFVSSSSGWSELPSLSIPFISSSVRFLLLLLAPSVLIAKAVGGYPGGVY